MEGNGEPWDYRALPETITETKTMPKEWLQCMRDMQLRLAQLCGEVQSLRDKQDKLLARLKKKFDALENGKGVE